MSTFASLMQGSNLRPSAYKAGALPAELMRRGARGRIRTGSVMGVVFLLLSPRAWCGIGLLLFGVVVALLCF